MIEKPLTLERMVAAINWRAECDDQYAELKGDVLRCEILCKRVRARVFVGEEGSVDLRKAKAEIHPDTMAADDELISAIIAFEKLRASRESADSVVEGTRTAEASRRKT